MLLEAQKSFHSSRRDAHLGRVLRGIRLAVSYNRVVQNAITVEKNGTRQLGQGRFSRVAVVSSLDLKNSAVSLKPSGDPIS